MKPFGINKIRNVENEKLYSILKSKNVPSVLTLKHFLAFNNYY